MDTVKGSLFREGALAAQSPAESLNLAPPVGTGLVSLASVGVCVSLLGLLFAGTHTQTLPAQGVVVPQTGIISISAPSAGLVRKVLVSEGEFVLAGTPLIEMELNRTSVGGASESQLGATLREKRKSIERALKLLALSIDITAEGIDKRIQIARKRILSLGDKLRIQEQRADAALSLYESWRTVGTQALSRHQIEQQYDTALQLVSLTSDTKDQVLQQQQEVSTLTAERRQLNSNAAQESSLLVQSLADVNNAIIEDDIAHGALIRSPVKGRVTTSTVLAGQYVEAGPAALLSIVDDSSPLVVEAWIPASVNGLPVLGQRASIVVRLGGGRSRYISASLVEISGSPYPAARIREMRGLKIDSPHYRVSLVPTHDGHQSHIDDLKPGAFVSVQIAFRSRSFVRSLFALN